MKTLLALVLSTAAAFAGPTVVYVSEGGDKRISIYTLDEQSGDLTRTGAIDLPGAPGSLAISPDRKHLYAAVRSAKEFATLSVDPKTGLLSNVVTAPAGINAAYVHVDKTGKWLLSASYGEGVAAVSRIKDGVIDGAPVSTVTTGPKAHSIQTDAANRFAFVPHVGDLNKVEQLRFDRRHRRAHFQHAAASRRRRRRGAAALRLPSEWPLGLLRQRAGKERHRLRLRRGERHAQGTADGLHRAGRLEDEGLLRGHPRERRRPLRLCLEPRARQPRGL